MRIDLSGFSPSNKSLKYLETRISDDSYRGDISSQQNRWNFDDLIFVLGALQKHSGDADLLRIRTTDRSRRAVNYSAEFVFAKFCEEVVSQIHKGSQDAMRKNWFVDWNRAGWIHRYNEKKELVPPFNRSQVSYVKITPEGMKLLSKTTTEQDLFYIFSKGIDILYKGTISILIDLFRNYKIKYIDLQEFTYFVTGINSKGKFAVTREECVELIHAWRTFTSLERRQIDQFLARALVKVEDGRNKTKQRDYQNWINKSQQTFSLLRQTIYFDETTHTDSHLNRLQLMIDEDIPDNEQRGNGNIRLSRSSGQKHLYFERHSIEKSIGFELHHIVALAWAESQHHFKLLDDWKNMIYIDGFTHATITQKNNRHVKIGIVTDDDIELMDLYGDAVPVNNPRNAQFAKENLPIMLDYNKRLLNIN